MLPPVEDYVKADDSEGVADRLDPLKQSSHLLEFDWVDPKVTGFTSVYLNCLPEWAGLPSPLS